MKQFSYPVYAYRQQSKSPIQVCFVAPSDEIIYWSGVPRKSDELLTGYQRFLSKDRVDSEIVPFFNDPRNCSPTAIIVSLRSDTGIGKCKLNGADNIEAGEIRPATLIIELDEDKIASNEIFQAALDYVNSRITSSSAADDGTEDEDTEDEEDADTEDDSPEDEDADAEDEEDVSDVHLGNETLAKMKELLSNNENWNNSDFKEAIVDYVKPVFLIDGQHRARAASQLGLPFMVCGLYDAPWEEQVFQFTVVNLKPKRIPPNLITSIAALSLTRSEQDELSLRLENAGVKMWEVDMMSRVAYENTSPFYELVNMAVGNPKTHNDLLGYASIKKVASIWYKCQYRSLVLIAKEISGYKSAKKAKDFWQENNLWYEFFCGFWNAIKDTMPDDLWQKNPGNYFFNGASLWALQETLLQEFNSYPQRNWQIDGGAEMEWPQRSNKILDLITTDVNEKISYIDSDMWTTPRPQEKQSQNTSAGMKDLVKLYSAFITQGSLTGRSPWKGWKSNNETKAWFIFKAEE